MSKLLEGPVKNGPESFEITVEIECTKSLKKTNNLLKMASVDCLLYFGGAHTIQDFFEFLFFDKLYAKTHFTTVIHGV